MLTLYQIWAATANEWCMEGVWFYYIVLGSSNVDVDLRGKMPKFDCSSADLNHYRGI
jgi:hypothetical protein